MSIKCSQSYGVQMLRGCGCDAPHTPHTRLCPAGGHFNPMVSAVMTYMRVIPLARFVTYVPAQVLGAIVGSSLQYFALAPDLQNAAHAGAQVQPPPAA